MEVVVDLFWLHLPKLRAANVRCVFIYLAIYLFIYTSIALFFHDTSVAFRHFWKGTIPAEEPKTEEELSVNSTTPFFRLVSFLMCHEMMSAAKHHQNRRDIPFFPFSYSYSYLALESVRIDDIIFKWTSWTRDKRVRGRAESREGMSASLGWGVSMRRGGELDQGPKPERVR